MFWGYLFKGTLEWEPQNMKPKNIVGFRDLVYSYYIIGVPCLKLPLKFLKTGVV